MNELDTLKAELAKVQKQLDEANKAKLEITNANWEKKFSDLEVVVANLKKEIETEKANVSAKTGEADVAKAALTKLEDEKKALVAELDKFKAEGLKAEAARIKLERLGKVKEAYNVTDEAKADQIVLTVAALTDEAFAAHIEAIKGIAKVTATVAPKVEPTVAALTNSTPVVEPNLAVAAINKDEDNAKALASELLASLGLEVDTENVEEGSVATKVKKTKVKNKK